MAKKVDFSKKPIGNERERELFHEVNGHYMLAKEDLDQRMSDWDTKDELFRSYIDETSWPYNSIVFDPRVFTALFEKTARLFANKPRGRLVPREGGDSLGAHICNELLKFQWDDVERTQNMPMLARWAQMDMSARKYGAGFALAKWRYERQKVKNGKNKKDEDQWKSVPWYDGPDFKPLINRDCLPNPSYSYIKNWFQVRDYPTIQELENVNDAARTKPVYKNLDLLRQRVKEGESTSGGDRRDVNYASRNKTIKGLTDYLGADEVFKTIEVITEYRNDKWITFAPKYGVVIRDIVNPYDHGQIPIVMLRYYPIDDDLYGLSEIEPVERLQKAINALVNQYLDAINMSLYTPLKVKAHAVQMHTLEFGPGKKWIMNEPAGDVIPHESSTSGVQEFTNTYSFMISALQNALGESSQGISGITPFNPEKTATEVQDTARQRLARDNFNQIFLSESMKKQMMFWHTMDKQFLFTGDDEKQKVIRIVGKDAIRYFERMGLNGYELPEGMDEEIARQAEDGVMMNPQDFGIPQHPVTLADGSVMPKFNVEEGGEMGALIIEPNDLAGTYDYIPDVESMEMPDTVQRIAIKRQALDLALKPENQALLQAEGYKLKVKELFEDYLEETGLTDADKYFEKGGMDGTLQAGAGVTPTSPRVGGNGPIEGVGGNPGAMVANQAQPVLPGPGAI